MSLANSATAGSGTLTINGGTLDNAGASPFTLSGNNPQAWNGSFAFLGTNPLNLGTGAVAMNGSPTVYVNASTLTVGGVISGLGALTLNGAGTLVLTASNTYAGTTTIAGGTLQLGTGVSGQDGSTPGSTITDNGALAFNLFSNRTYGGTISGSGALIQAGPGLLQLTASNTFTGGTTITGGTLVNANAAATGGTSAAIAINGGSNNVELQFTTGIINSGAATVYKPMSVAC